MAKLHAVKVLNSSGSGSYSDVIAGVNWVASKASPSIPVVANMSLGGPTSDTLDAAIASARAQGVIFAVAAGNDGRDAQRFSPARSPDAITVSATKGDASQDCKVADDWPKWSNYGDAVDIAAPGVGIRSTKLGGGTISYSGTSMASPHVAGAIALWLASGLAADGNDADDDLFNEALAAIVSKAELTDGTDGGCWTNTSRKPHSEAFLNVD